MLGAKLTADRLISAHRRAAPPSYPWTSLLVQDPQ